MMVFTLSCCATWPFPPWTHLTSSITIFRKDIFVFYIGVGWQHPFLGTLLATCGNHVSGPVMVVFTLSCCATWPFPPWTHLNSSITILERLYLCSTMVLGGSTHFLELYYLWKPCVWAGHGGFHPVLLSYLALLSMDPP